MGKFAPPHWRSACEKLPTVGQTAIFCLIPKVGDETWKPTGMSLNQ